MPNLADTSFRIVVDLKIYYEIVKIKDFTTKKVNKTKRKIEKNKIK